MNAFLGDIDRRLDVAGWGLFCLVSGVVLLVPALPEGTWLTLTGAIIVSFAAVRGHLGLPVSWFWTVMGVGFAVIGAAALAGLTVPWFAALTIACGVGLMADVLVSRPVHE